MTYHVPPHVHFRVVDDEAMIFDARNDGCLALNASATTAWLILTTGGSLEAAIEAVLERFTVEAKVARADVAALIEHLVSLGLLE